MPEMENALDDKFVSDSWLISKWENWIFFFRLDKKNLKFFVFNVIKDF